MRLIEPSRCRVVSLGDPFHGLKRLQRALKRIMKRFETGKLEAGTGWSNIDDRHASGKTPGHKPGSADVDRHSSGPPENFESVGLGSREIWVTVPAFAKFIGYRIDHPRKSESINFVTFEDAVVQHGYSDSQLLAKVKEIATTEKRYPDEFYKMVAGLYARGAARTSSPAKEIADGLDSPVSTVWRWIRVCRSKGYLPPARAGKEG